MHEIYEGKQFDTLLLVVKFYGIVKNGTYFSAGRNFRGTFSKITED